MDFLINPIMGKDINTDSLISNFNLEPVILSVPNDLEVCASDSKIALGDIMSDSEKNTVLHSSVTIPGVDNLWHYASELD